MEATNLTPVLEDFSLDMQTGVVTLQFSGDLSVYDYTFDHPVVEIVNALMRYCANPLRLKAEKKEKGDREYIRFTPEFPVYDGKCTVCKLDPSNINGTRSSILFLENVRRTFEDLKPYLIEGFQTFFEKPHGYALYARKLAEMKSIDRQIAKITSDMERLSDPNRIARCQSHLANLEEARYRKANELKTGIKAFILSTGLLAPEKKDLHNLKRDRALALLNESKVSLTELIFHEKEVFQELMDYAEADA